MGSMLFRDPQARSSVFAALGMLQHQAFRSLNGIDPLDLVSNYIYITVFMLIKQKPKKLDFPFYLQTDGSFDDHQRN